MELPFEKDTPELLAACAMALRPLSALSPAKEEAPQMPSEVQPHAGTLWQRFPGGNAVMKQSGGSFGAATQTALPNYLPERSTGISVEALSRAVERDARRFDAKA